MQNGRFWVARFLCSAVSTMVAVALSDSGNVFPAARFPSIRSPFFNVVIFQPRDSGKPSFRHRLSLCTASSTGSAVGITVLLLVNTHHCFCLEPA